MGNPKLFSRHGTFLLRQCFPCYLFKIVCWIGSAITGPEIWCPWYQRRLGEIGKHTAIKDWVRNLISLTNAIKFKHSGKGINYYILGPSDVVNHEFEWGIFVIQRLTNRVDKDGTAIKSVLDYQFLKKTRDVPNIGKILQLPRQWLDIQVCMWMKLSFQLRNETLMCKQ